jgi:hypothetical protein
MRFIPLIALLVTACAGTTPTPVPVVSPVITPVITPAAPPVIFECVVGYGGSTFGIVDNTGAGTIFESSGVKESFTTEAFIADEEDGL